MELRLFDYEKYKKFRVFQTELITAGIKSTNQSADEFKKNKYYICNNTNQNLSPEQVQEKEAE